MSFVSRRGALQFLCAAVLLLGGEASARPKPLREMTARELLGDSPSADLAEAVVSGRMSEAAALLKRCPFAGDTLLIESVFDLARVRVVVEHGADVDLRPEVKPNVTGGTTAAEHAAAIGRLDVVAYLLDHGAGKRDRLVYDDIAWTLQMRMWSPDAERDRVELLKRLFRAGAHIYRSTNNPQTPRELLHLGPDARGPHPRFSKVDCGPVPDAPRP